MTFARLRSTYSRFAESYTAIPYTARAPLPAAPNLRPAYQVAKKCQVFSTYFQIEIFRGVILSLTYGLGTLWGWSTNTSHDQFMTVRTWRPGISPDHLHSNIPFAHASIPMYQVIFTLVLYHPPPPFPFQEPDAPGFHLRRDRFWKCGGEQLFSHRTFIRTFHLNFFEDLIFAPL